MEYREVGNTGVQVSEIGFGGGGNAGLMVRGTPEQQREAVGRAIELGINYFDQSPDYGDRVSETNLGRLMKELSFRPYITTKIEVRAENLDDIAGHVTRSLDESLECLGVDYVDFLQIHNGTAHGASRAVRPRLCTWLWIEDYLRPGGALEGLQRAQKSGKARFIGFITRGGDGDAARQLIDTTRLQPHQRLGQPAQPVGGGQARRDALRRRLGRHPELCGQRTASEPPSTAPLAGWFLTDNAAEGGTVAPPCPRGRAARQVDAEGLHCERGRLRFLSRRPQPRHAGGRPQPGRGRTPVRALTQRGLYSARRLLGRPPGRGERGLLRQGPALGAEHEAHRDGMAGKLRPRCGGGVTVMTGRSAPLYSVASRLIQAVRASPGYAGRWSRAGVHSRAVATMIRSAGSPCMSGREPGAYGDRRQSTGISTSPSSISSIRARRRCLCRSVSLPLVLQHPDLPEGDGGNGYVTRLHRAVYRSTRLPDPADLHQIASTPELAYPAASRQVVPVPSRLSFPFNVDGFRRYLRWIWMMSRSMPNQLFGFSRYGMSRETGRPFFVMTILLSGGSDLVHELQALRLELGCLDGPDRPCCHLTPSRLVCDKYTMVSDHGHIALPFFHSRNTLNKSVSTVPVIPAQAGISQPCGAVRLGVASLFLRGRE